MLSEKERTVFEEDGYVVLRHLVGEEDITRLREVAMRDWREGTLPVEYESEVSLPDEDLKRTDTRRATIIRRLSNAFVRDPTFYKLITGAAIAGSLRKLLKTDEVVMPLGHHNCIMTKAPNGGTETKWHQDFRYWHFQNPNLVSLWLALGEEFPSNGCLRVIPGSHRVAFSASSFDSHKFFRTDYEGNQSLLESAVDVELKPGDVLLFHCFTLHSAGPNTAAAPKFSAVFTFRDSRNLPKPGSRSAICGEFVLPRPIEA
ncbi:MAG: phytanoyl-CoA hydroxylase [Verrucomicrobiales bacterium]|jgi:phytanoyl-CoA hydroxylase